MPTTKGSFKLTVEPAEHVVFNGPFDKETVVELKLTNADDGKRRAFKVKCTANTMFKIRPAVGKLDPGKTSTATVKLTCKALGADEVPNDDKHLFSVYHITVDKDDVLPRKAWADHTGEIEGSVRMDVRFKKADGDKKEDKKDDKKEDKKEEKKEDKEEPKKEEKKDEEKKEEKADDKKEDEKKDEDKKEDGDKEEKKEEDKAEE